MRSWQSLPLSQPQAAKSLINRVLARRTLQPFIEWTTPRWEAGRIHREICEQLDRVVSGEVDRLMLLCPPQHGKSHIASRRLPAFMLGRRPDIDIISASATFQLAEEFGRDVRDCIASREYQVLFPGTRLAEDSQARGHWHTAEGGSYYAVGIGGALMGRGAQLGIIDDPFASWEDSQSILSRDRLWDWYLGTFYNRIRPHGAIAVIQHRMAEDDLAGQLIERQKAGGDQWVIVEIPALLADPPWVERYDREALERIKANTDPRKWSALYLQNPTPEEGTFFQRAWFKRFRPEDAKGHAYTTADFAVTEGGGDYTELATHKYHGDTLYLGVEGWNGQTAADQWIEQLIDMFARHKPLCFFGESGPIRRAIEPFLTRRMRERRTFCRLEWLVRGSDKPTMARALQALAASGKVQIADTEYGERLLTQLLQFPAGSRDDAVDMAALMGLAISEAHPGVIQVHTTPVIKDRWDKVFDREKSQGWKTA